MVVDGTAEKIYGAGNYYYPEAEKTEKTLKKSKKGYSLAGMEFGRLKVIGKAENQRKNGGVWWTCSCSCGKIVDYPATLLVKGKRTSCGCRNEKNYYMKDITNQKFGALTALYPTSQRDKKGNIIWHCSCDNCGNETDISYNELLYTNRKSCGCLKKAHEESFSSLLTRVADTSIDSLKSTKLPVNNTTGRKGVYWVRGRYLAKIVFQKKAYYLGRYDSFEDAVAAREAAEELIAGGTVEHYEKWKQKADTDPLWAKENPFEIKVEKGRKTGIRITYYPQL